MHATLDVWTDEADTFFVCPEPDGRASLTFRGAGRVSVSMTAARLRRLRDVISGYLEIGPAGEPDGSVDYVDIVPAEAVVDTDDLLDSIASSYEVRRGGWQGDPTEEELAIGRRNCPREVP